MLMVPRGNLGGIFQIAIVEDSKRGFLRFFHGKNGTTYAIFLAQLRNPNGSISLLR